MNAREYGTLTAYAVLTLNVAANELVLTCSSAASFIGCLAA